MPKLVVAICGRKQHGKDCAAMSLVATGFCHEKFASPLKQACALLFSFDDDQVHGAKKDAVDPRWGKTPREILQFVGTEMFQYKMQEILPDVGRGFWARSLVERIARSDADRFVISDMRFQHELDALNGIPDCRVVGIRVVRECVVCDDPHASESELDDIRPVVEIRNDGSKEDLYRSVRVSIARRSQDQDVRRGCSRPP